MIDPLNTLKVRSNGSARPHPRGCCCVFCCCFVFVFCFPPYSLSFVSTSIGRLPDYASGTSKIHVLFNHVHYKNRFGWICFGKTFISQFASVCEQGINCHGTYRPVIVCRSARKGTLHSSSIKDFMMVSRFGFALAINVSFKF